MNRIMHVRLRKIGNSWGVVIPHPLLAEIGAEGGRVEITVENGRIVIEAKTRAPRLGWADASRRLTEMDDDALVWPELTNADDEALAW